MGNQFIVHDLFFTDSAEPVSVPAPRFGPSAVFLLRPVRPSDRRRWQRQYHMCPVCLGLTFIPVGNWPKCPKCGGKEGPSYADEDIREKVLAEVATGWEGWHTESGQEVAFTGDNRDCVARDREMFEYLLGLAADQVRSVEAAEGE